MLQIKDNATTKLAWNRDNGAKLSWLLSHRKFDSQVDVKRERELSLDADPSNNVQR